MLSILCARGTELMRFRATVELNGKTATGIEVPAEVVAEMGRGQRPPVTATLNGHSYRTTVGSMGGRFLIRSALRSARTPASRPATWWTST
jgi:Domain of unknown function (DUF1905)